MSLLAVLMVSCSESTESKTKKAEHIIMPAQTIIKVEIKRTSQELPFDHKDVAIFPEAKESNANNLAGSGVEVLEAVGGLLI